MIEAPVTQIVHHVTSSATAVDVSAAVATTEQVILLVADNGRKGESGADGHSPVLTWRGDQIVIDGIASGPHLTGPAGADGQNGEPGADGSPGIDGVAGADGHSPVLTWSGDQIAIDGIASGPHLTGPQGPTGQQGVVGADGVNGTDGHSPMLAWVGDKISIDGVATGPSLTGPQGVKGETGSQGPQGETGPQGIPGADGLPGDQRVFVQDTAPDFAGATGLWLQTGLPNNGMTLWIEDGL